jgi:ketosteroid isomerase-like protein
MTKKITGCIILLFVFVLPVAAQSKKEARVAAATEALRKAMIAADAQQLDRLTDEKLNYGHSGGQVDNKSAFLQKLISGSSDFVSIALTNQTITISKNMAMVRHHLKATTNDNGKPGEVQLNVLLIWQKLHGKWKLIARQAVKMG